MSTKLDIEEFIQEYMKKYPPPLMLEDVILPDTMKVVTKVVKLRWLPVLGKEEQDEQEITNPN